MRMALLSKNKLKLKFVDKSIVAPSTSYPLFPAWERCNTMMLSWITQSLSPTIAQSILWIVKSYDVWQDLKDRVFQGDIFKIPELQEEIYFKQGELSVSKYFTKLTFLCDELINLRPIPFCTCKPSCSSGTIEKAIIYQQEDYVIRFLKGLNDRFSTVKSQIMLIDPLPSMKRDFSLVVLQEREMNCFIDSKTLLNKDATKRPKFKQLQGE